MAAPRKYPDEMRDRAVRLVADRVDDPELQLSLTAACTRVGGDPAKAARAILAALDAPSPPLRLVLGNDAVDGVRGRLDALGAELAAWEAVGRDTAMSP